MEATVAAIQGRWGRQALQREAIPALDRVLTGRGAIPRGRITELLLLPGPGRGWPRPFAGPQRR